MRFIRLKPKDVPAVVIYEDDKGQQELYELAPASRKFGLSLQGISEALKRMLRLPLRK